MTRSGALAGTVETLPRTGIVLAPFALLLVAAASATALYRRSRAR